MPSTLQIWLAYGFIALLAALVLWLNIAGRKEFARRRALPPDERERLADADWKWSQRYGF